jgi:predicted Zn-dependent protease
MILDRKSQSHHYQLSHLSFDIPDDRSVFCYIGESMKQLDLAAITRWVDERVQGQRFQAIVYDSESRQWLDETIGSGRVSINPQFHSLQDLGLSLSSSQQGTMPPRESAILTDVAQLDRMINDGLVASDRGTLSPELNQLLDAYLSASAALKNGNLYEAVNGYQDIVSACPDFVAPRVNLGHCMLYLGDHHQALHQFELAHELAPSDPDIHIAAGRVYEALGNKSAELQQYQAAVADDPHYVEALTNLGVTYREIGELEQSYIWLERALERIEQEEQVSYQPGWQHPNKGNTLAGMAQTCEASGDWRRALKYWESAKAVAPHDTRIDACIQQARRKARWSWFPGRR